MRTWHSLPMGRVLCLMPQGKLVQIEGPEKGRKQKDKWEILTRSGPGIPPAGRIWSTSSLPAPGPPVTWLGVPFPFAGAWNLQASPSPVICALIPASQPCLWTTAYAVPSAWHKLVCFPTPCLKSCLVPRPTQLKRPVLEASHHLLTQPLPFSSACP